MLKDLCDLEAFYYSSLDRCADALSKLFEGKDPIKDILMNLEHIISSKAVESEKLAKSIKDDLMPHLEASINVKAQQALKDKVNDVRNIRASVSGIINTDAKENKDAVLQRKQFQESRS